MKSHKYLPKVLTIAGSDPIGGAGIQADLKTFGAHSVYGMSVVTALVAENTIDVHSIHEVPIEFVRAQADSVMEDIIPDAVKIGMLGSIALIQTVAEILRQHNLANVVVDPVLVATSGTALSHSGVESTLLDVLMPLATVATPNIPEAQALAGMSITTEDDMVRAAQSISERAGCAVLVKGGHFDRAECVDVLYSDGVLTRFVGARVATTNTHGTGCTLSSAIAANLASGSDLIASVAAAKEYVAHCLAHSPKIGRGNGAMNHFA